MIFSCEHVILESEKAQQIYFLFVNLLKIANIHPAPEKAGFLLVFDKTTH